MSDHNPRPKGHLLDHLIQIGASFPVPDEDLQKIPRVIADEPARWYYEESDREYWHEDQEFRNVAPIYPLIWLEWHAPRFVNSEEFGVTPWPAEAASRFGALVMSHDDEEWHALVDRRYGVRPSGARWWSVAYVYTDDAKHDTAGLKWSFAYGVRPDGSLLSGGFSQRPEGQLVDMLEEAAERSFPGAPRAEVVAAYGQLATEVGGVFIGALRVAMLSIYFMHSKGTELRPVRVPKKVADARKKRGQPTGEGYRVLDVGLGARRELDAARSEGKGSQTALRRLHLRRGHFATYTEAKPHVSGFVGTMWRSPAVVGRGEAVEKDYRVRTAGAPPGSTKERKKRKKRRKR